MLMIGSGTRCSMRANAAKSTIPPPMRTMLTEVPTPSLPKSVSPTSTSATPADSVRPPQ